MRYFDQTRVRLPTSPQIAVTASAVTLSINMSCLNGKNTEVLCSRFLNFPATLLLNWGWMDLMVKKVNTLAL